MKIFYDLHIHTALSPCADPDMTPCNIVNMAKLKELDVIAVTDHNSTLNARAVAEASKRLKGPIVIAGAEITLSEDIHAVLLFRDFDSADECGKELEKRRFKIKNRVKAFSRQVLFDSYDNVIGEEQNLLLAPTDISTENIADFAAKYNAICFYAHIDRPSNGILAVLGGFPPQMRNCTVELNAEPSEELNAKLKEINAKILYDSDSHLLGSINERDMNYLEANELSVECILDALKA